MKPTDARAERGFLLLAQNLPGVDYVRQARVLARSIHQSHSEPIGVSLVVDEPVLCGEEFDQVIQLPVDDAAGASWKIHNKWQLWWLSPYERTLWLDSDMVVPIDISWWWRRLEGTSIRFCTRPVDFAGRSIRREVYRRAWLRAQLPMVYTGLTYFDKSPRARRLFEAAEGVFRHWPRISRQLGIQDRSVSGDLAFSVAVEILGEHEAVPEVDDFFRFVHMKPRTFRSGEHIDQNWARSLRMVVDKGIWIEGIRQRFPFHYVDKTLVDFFDRALAGHPGSGDARVADSAVISVRRRRDGRMEELHAAC